MEYTSLRDFVLSYTDETNPNTSFVEKLITMLQKQRGEVNKEIFSFAHRLQDLKNLVFLQSEIFTLRQKLLEDNHILLDKLNILNAQLVASKKEATENMNRNVQIRYNSADERNIVMMGMDKLKEMNQKIELLINHTIFLKDTMTKLDDMKFAIRNTIDINALLGSVPQY